jgi:SAM-dependent methyltransferase
VARLLEGGVGVGAYAALWARLGVEHWVGVDISEEAVQDLRSRFPAHQFEADDMTQLQLEEQGFDLVTAIDVLYHLVDDTAFTAALGQLGQRVRPGGWLLASDVFCKESRRTAEHVKRRPLEAYEGALSPLGFSVVQREPVFAVLDDPVARGGFRPGDRCLQGIWRLLSGTLCRVPAGTRELLGGRLVRALTPLDAMLRALGVTRGVNLELALFRRRGDGDKMPSTPQRGQAATRSKRPSTTMFRHAS